MKRWLTAAILALFLAPLVAAQSRVPRESWLRYADPEQAGWSNEKLAQARTLWQSLDSAA